ncbi:hypothetical protein KZO37_21495 [Rhodococcus fascians]|nr:hypothetical protein [Rhodococcus fascians]MBW4781940.1 hypothetical protein [Rhodococcus fascians]
MLIPTAGITIAGIAYYVFHTERRTNTANWSLPLPLGVTISTGTGKQQ